MKNKELLFSAFIYGVGLLSLLFSDLYVSNKFTENFIADWAFYKSTIIIVGSIALFGYDQVFIRNQELIKSYKFIFLKNLFVFTVLVILCVYLFRGDDTLSLLKLFLSIIFFSILSYFSAASRASFNLWKSQFSTNAWKIFLFPLLFLISGSSIDYFFISVLISLVCSYFLKGFLPKEGNLTKSNISLGDERKIARSFMFTSLTLLLSTYGEQFVINMFNKESLSSELFRYYAYFTPIAFSINGFVGFILGPRIRKMSRFTVKDFNRLNLIMLILTFLCCIVSFVGGYIYVNLINKSQLKIDFLILFILFLLAIVRGLYTATSVCLGVFGDYISIRKTALGFWISVFIYIGILFITLLFNFKYSLHIIVMATLLNWVLRLLISNYFSYKSIKQINYETK